jgi:hypothetical protein
MEVMEVIRLENTSLLQESKTLRLHLSGGSFRALYVHELNMLLDALQLLVNALSLGHKCCVRRALPVLGIEKWNVDGLTLGRGYALRLSGLYVHELKARHASVDRLSVRLFYHLRLRQRILLRLVHVLLRLVHVLRLQHRLRIRERRLLPSDYAVEHVRAHSRRDLLPGLKHLSRGHRKAELDRDTSSGNLLETDGVP